MNEKKKVPLKIVWTGGGGGGYRKMYFATGLMFDRLVGNVSKKDGLQKKGVEKK